MSEVRTVKLLRVDGQLILEIPEDRELPDGDVEIWKEGDRLMIRPAVNEPQPPSIDAPAAGP